MTDSSIEAFDLSGDLEDRFDADDELNDVFTEPGYVRHPGGGQAYRQCTIRIPMWLEKELSAEARHRGVPRSSIVNTALVEWIEDIDRRRAATTDAPQEA